MINKTTLIQAAILNDRKAMTDLVHLTLDLDTLEAVEDRYAYAGAFALKYLPMVQECYTWANVTDLEVLQSVLAIINDKD